MKKKYDGFEENSFRNRDRSIVCIYDTGRGHEKRKMRKYKVIFTFLFKLSNISPKRHLLQKGGRKASVCTYMHGKEYRRTV